MDLDKSSIVTLALVVVLTLGKLAFYGFVGYLMYLGARCLIGG